jgi:hypothetical protein
MAKFPLYVIAALMSFMPPMRNAQAPITRSVIEGKVIDFQTMKPISPAWVSIDQIDPDTADTIETFDFKTMVTGDSGDFRFELPPGYYVLRADDRVKTVIRRNLEVRAGLDILGIRIEMRTVGMLSGTAIDDHGAPMVNFTAEILAFHDFNGLRVLVPVPSFVRALEKYARTVSVQTNEHGEFQFTGLESGEYYVRVSPPDKGSLPMYTTTYFPNVTRPEEAVKVVVDKGSDVTGVEVHVASNAASVRIRVVGLRPGEVPGKMFLIPRNAPVLVPPKPATVYSTDSDQFEIINVTPGSYYLYLRGPNSANRPDWVRTPIEVGTERENNVTIALIPRGSIKGRIVVHPATRAGDNLDFSSLRFLLGFTELIPIDWTSSGSAVDYLRASSRIFTQASADGTFEIPNVPEGILSLRELTFQDGWFISDVTFDGRDVTRSGFSVEAGRQSILEIVISNVGGKVSGVIRDRENNPVPGARYVLLPERSLRSNPSLIMTGASYEKGGFDIQSIPPGEYTLLAFPDDDRFSSVLLRDPERVQRYEPFGEHIHIAAGDSVVVTVVVAPDLDR